MSDTPRTDDGYRAHYAEHDHNRELCAGLERELAAAQATINQLRCAIDRLDCTVREGGQALHCPTDNQCLRCRFNSAQAKLTELGENLKSANERDQSSEKMLLEFVRYSERVCGYSNHDEIGKEFNRCSTLGIAKLSAKIAELDRELLYERLDRCGCVRDGDNGSFRLLCAEHEKLVSAAQAKIAELEAHHERDCATMAKLSINEASASFGNGTAFEEAVIDAGTKYIARTIGFYSTGDRRFTMGLYNTMLRAAIRELKNG